MSNLTQTPSNILFGGHSTAELSKLTVKLPPYIYKPLVGERNIRVLEVYGSDSYDTSLCFKIVTISLDSVPAPHYYAVSYCWEGQDPSRTVICEGQTIQITANCEAALKQFRPPHGEMVLIWIDAICIDQARGAVRERNEQVFMMGDVYSHAQQVWVWLGSDRMRTLSPSSFRILKWLQDLSVAACIDDPDVRDEKVCRVTLEVNHQDLHDLEYDMPWFARIWVLQEVVLSRSALLFRDAISINYRGLITATNIIEGHACTKPTLLLHDTYLRTNFRMFRRLEAIKNKHGTRSGLREIWNNARRLNCSDPRDKVFALHSLLTTIGVPLLPPDYTKDLGTVYRETTKAILVYDRSLGILKQITGLGNPSPHLSSWSPDWNQRVYPKRPFPGPGLKFKASGKSQPSFSFAENGRLAICQGKILETISTVAKDSLTHTWERLGAAEEYASWTMNAEPQNEFWKDLLETTPEWSEQVLVVWNVHVLQTLVAFVASTAKENEAEDIYKDLQDCFGDFIESDSGSYARVAKFVDWDAWRKSIMGGSSNANTNTTTSPSQNTTNTHYGEQTFRVGNREIGDFRHLRSRLQNSLSSNVTAILEREEFRAWERVCRDHSQAALHGAIMSTTHYQTLFRTHLTNSLGMAPHSVREGDQIALLAGLDSPMIIRPLENGNYRMITAGYVCGLMAGEAWHRSWNDGTGLDDLIFE